MTDYVAALKRQRAHLRAIGADAAKLAENAVNLRLAGVDVDELDEEPKKEPAPVGRTAAKKLTTDAKPAGDDIKGSGGITLPKPKGGGK